MSAVLRALAVISTAAVVSACNGGDTEPNNDPLVMAISAGNAQTGTVGQPLPTDPSVKATRGGTPVSGVAVQFTTASGSGSVATSSATTGPDGIASAGAWTLGTVAGAQALTASSQGVDNVTFTATANAGAAANVTKQGGDAQTAAAGLALANRPAVKVVDQYGNPVQGASVTFAVTGGNGTVTGATVNTGADGTAMVGGWTLGQTPGPNTLTATVAGAGITGNPAIFTATAVAGAAANAAKHAGDAQTAQVATPVTIAPAVRITDQFGNPVPGVNVTFAVGSGGGTVTDANATTGSDGVATVGSWTLGNVAGAQTLNVTVTGIAGIATTINATATAGAPAALVKVAGDGGTGTVATAVTTRPSVRVNDQFGNPVEGVNVTFATTVGAGVVTGAQQTTGADGTATVGSWNLSQTAGPNTVRATATGNNLSGNPADFTVTAMAGAPAALSKQGGDAQTATPNAPVAVPPSVRLTDQFGNPILGQTVNFLVTGGGGTLTGASPQTNADGVATVGSWTLGPAMGANTLSATAATFTVNFSATAAALLNAGLYTGTYNGTWTNTTFGSTDVAAVTIVNAAPGTSANVTISASGNVLGQPGGIPPELKVVNYTQTSATFTGAVTKLGNVTLNITTSATPDVLNIVASALNPAAGISRWDATGTMSPTQISLNFTVTFNAGAPAVGVIVLNKAP